MPRLNYALAIDAVRAVAPKTTEADLTNDRFVGEDGEDKDIVESRVEAAESEWDRRATPMRPVRVGSTSTPIIEDARGTGHPVKIYLEHMNILPFDSSEGDVLEVRSGRDSWNDITDSEGSAWTADYRKGVLSVYRHAGRGVLPALNSHRDRFARLSYRIGAGGEYKRAGQTTLAETLAQGTTGSVNVSDASRLPETGGVFLVNGEEYIDVDTVDEAADTITINTGGRGLRGTSDGERSDGDVVHYCPMDVREAVAARAGMKLLANENWIDQLRSTSIDPETKLEELKDTWEGTVAQYRGG